MGEFFSVALTNNYQQAARISVHQELSMSHENSFTWCGLELSRSRLGQGMHQDSILQLSCQSSKYKFRQGSQL